MGMVFQSYALYPHMTVAENMAFGLKLASVEKREIARRVEAAAAILQLDKLLERKPKDLSGGQRQRVAIGRTMVREPKVFLFDEPLSNLDAFLRVQMRIEIARLHQRIRSTMIYVTHDQVEAMTLADKIVVLNAGEIAQVGQPLHLYHYPQNRFVAGFLGSPQMNFVDVRAISASPEAVTIELPSGFPLTLPVDGSAVSPGDPLTLGIRPEHFVMPDQADFTFHGQITVAERLGQYNLLHLTLERLQDVITSASTATCVSPRARPSPPASRPTSATCSARTARRAPGTIGSRPSTGKRLRQGGATEGGERTDPPTRGACPALTARREAWAYSSRGFPTGSRPGPDG